MTARDDLRVSVRATYDSTETGPRYWVRSTIDDRPVGDGTTPIADPFVRHTVRVSLLDLLRGVIRRGLVVEVTDVVAEKPLDVLAERDQLRAELERIRADITRLTEEIETEVAGAFRETGPGLDLTAIRDAVKAGGPDAR